jgi:amino acid adenylation domain-containing protein
VRKTSATISMSTLPPPASNIGSSWLGFLRRDPQVGKSAAAGRFLRIPEEVAAYAAQSPQLPAVVAAKKTLTYGELESQSNALARHLLSLGAVPETLVAVFLPRSPSAVVAALAIMKTGAAYLPLDPSCPSGRIRLILEDARVPIVISDSSATSSLPSGAWQIVRLGEPQGTQRARSSTPLPYTANPSQLAYVIYTSGSTGRPKGVEITHGNLSNLVRWHQSAFAVCPSDRATILASPGFDASVWEVWPYLTSGATLHMPSDATRVSPRALRDWMLSNAITISFVPTPLAQRLMLLDWPAETPLRFLLTGADTLQQYPRAGLPFTLVNNYGPTECTVVSTSCAVTYRDHPSALPPIGRPIANTQAFVLDEHLQQVPQGSVGELHIAGAGVGRGYLHNPQLTQQKFIPNPFSSERGSRLYKTGDLVRPWPDGNLEFVGRADDQVKIRGYRVEPNEVSHALCKHDAVEAGIVVARKDRRRKHVLVAYVLPKPGVALNVAALRAYLQQHLPDYMIPSAFVLMHIFPLTTNGKVDRSALPPPNASNTLPGGAAPTAVAALESSTS